MTYVRRFAGDPTNEPNPVLGPVEEPPFHGMRLRFVGTGIGSSGVRPTGTAGSSTAGRPRLGPVRGGLVRRADPAGSGYNSGIALGRGLTLAYLVSSELAGAPVD